MSSAPPDRPHPSNADLSTTCLFHHAETILNVRLNVKNHALRQTQIIREVHAENNCDSTAGNEAGQVRFGKNTVRRMHYSEDVHARSANVANARRIRLITRPQTQRPLVKTCQHHGALFAEAGRSRSRESGRGTDTARAFAPATGGLYGAGQVARARRQACAGHQPTPARHGFRRRGSVREEDARGQRERLPEDAAPGAGRSPAPPPQAQSGTGCDVRANRFSGAGTVPDRRRDSNGAGPGLSGAAPPDAGLRPRSQAQ